MTEQEQEHWDHEAGSASELQNCLSEARMSLSAHNAGSWDRINLALREGKFVVVSKSAWYCRATDGLAGEAVSLECVRDTREAAELAAQQEMERTQGESDCSVLPVEEKQELAAMWAARPVDDCPF
jgi:hypothetical protein